MKKQCWKSNQIKASLKNHDNIGKWMKFSGKMPKMKNFKMPKKWREKFKLKEFIIVAKKYFQKICLKLTENWKMFKNQNTRFSKKIIDEKNFHVFPSFQDVIL